MTRRRRWVRAAAVGAGLLAGCAAPAPSPAPALALGSVAGLGLGTGAGALLGDKLAGGTGAVVGGVAGLGAAAWLENRGAAAEANEAVEAARREERQKIMRQYWYDQTEAPRGATEAAADAPVPLRYPAGNYDGVNFGPRFAPDPSLSEPRR